MASQSGELHRNPDGDFYDEEHSLNLSRNLYEQLDNGEFCDMVIKVEGQVFPVHRNVVVASSAYFRSLYSSQMAESRSNEVELHCGPPETIRYVIQYMYIGSISLTTENSIPILKCADHLLMKSLVDLCENFLIEKGNELNCFKMMDIAELYSLKKLKKCVTLRVRRTFNTLANTEEAMDISHELMKELLSNEGLCTTEERLFEFMLSWIRHDRVKREGHFLDFVPLIRWGVLKREFLINKMECEPILKDSPECQKLLVTILQSIILPSARPQEIAIYFKPRIGQVKDAILILPKTSQTHVRLANANVDVLAYIPCSNSWITTTLGVTYKNEVMARSLCHSASLRNKVNSCLLWNPNQIAICTWSSGRLRLLTKNIPQNAGMRLNGKVVHLDDGKIFLIGGEHFTNRNILASVMTTKIDWPNGNSILKSRWNWASRMPVPCRAVEVVVFRSVFFVLGGRSAQGFLCFQRYDTASNRWRDMGPSIIPYTLSKCICLTQTVTDKIHFKGI